MNTYIFLANECGMATHSLLAVPREEDEFEWEQLDASYHDPEIFE